MVSLYNLITITRDDLSKFENQQGENKIHQLIEIVLSELPKHYESMKSFLSFNLKPIKGFEDSDVKGFELEVSGSKDVERFIHRYIPFLIMLKNPVGERS